ncbi:MAG: hypothetical protein WB987_18290 [Candidatus Acidiferrales bacterium]
MASLFIAPESAHALFFLAVIVVVGWFAIGMFLNIRKGNAVGRWMQDGLPLLGEKTTLRWLGSSGVELKLQDARKPLSHVEIFILLEPRDVPFLWAFFHARGRRDILIVRCQAPSPRFQLEAFDPEAWSTRAIRKEARQKQWSSIETPPDARLIARGEGRLEGAARLLRLAAGGQLPLVRLAIRRSVPQLEVQWQLDRFGRASSRVLFETFHQIAQEL